MTTFILPGYSLNNDGWAKELPNSQFIRWHHWDSGQPEPGWLGVEADRIINQMNGQKVNLLAKSVGTLITMKILGNHPELTNKIILNGIPMNDFQPGDEASYNSLANFPPEKILVLQNSTDPHGSFVQANELIHGINPNIHVLETPRSDHEYPFYQEFRNFLTDV